MAFTHTSDSTSSPVNQAIRLCASQNSGSSHLNIPELSRRIALQVYFKYSWTCLCSKWVWLCHSFKFMLIASASNYHIFNLDEIMLDLLCKTKIPLFSPSNVSIQLLLCCIAINCNPFLYPQRTTQVNLLGAIKIKCLPEISLVLIRSSPTTTALKPASAIVSCWVCALSYFMIQNANNNTKCTVEHGQTEHPQDQRYILQVGFH